MKQILIGIIKIYQKVPGPWHNSCKYHPTCSHYAIEAIDEYGAILGSGKAIWRILRCNPWSKGGYDPLRRKNEKNN